MKWSGAIAAVLLLVAWGASEVRWFNVETTNWTFHLARGEVIVVRHVALSYRAPPGWYSGDYDLYRVDRRWRVQAWDTSGGTMPLPFNRVRGPLWMPTVVALLCAGVAWRCGRRARLRDRGRVCRECGYDRAGLAEGSGCPECNALPPARSE